MSGAFLIAGAIALAVLAGLGCRLLALLPGALADGFGDVSNDLSCPEVRPNADSLKANEVFNG